MGKCKMGEAGEWEMSFGLLLTGEKMTCLLTFCVFSFSILWLLVSSGLRLLSDKKKEFIVQQFLLKMRKKKQFST